MQLGVQAQNLHNELKSRLDRLNGDANAALGWLPNDVLSYVSTLVNDTKEIINWLDRYGIFLLLSNFQHTTHNIPHINRMRNSFYAQLVTAFSDSIAFWLIQFFFF
jgi:hypothetical protein